MSRCYPYPPPGYQKKASADQPVLELAPATQVTHKEKHKHKDKEKKKKRKREEKDDNAHKEKRSSKNHKAAHLGVVHPGENGRVSEPSACADNGQGVAVKASVPERESRPNRDGSRLSSAGLLDGARISSGETGKQDALHEARISSTSVKASPRDAKPAEASRISVKAVEASKPAGKEAKASVTSVRASSSTGKVSTPEVKVSGSAGKLQESSNARPASQETRKSSSDKTGKQRAEKPASTASTSKHVVLDKEINGKVPSLRTHAEQDQQQRQQQQEQLQKHRQPQVQDQPLPQPQSRQKQPPPREGPQLQPKEPREAQQQQPKEAQQEKEAHQRSGGGGGSGGDGEKREGGGSEKREKRSRLSDLKLPEVPTEVNNTYDDNYLEWLFPNKRRPEGKREGESSRDQQEEQEVWADAVYLSSVDVIALPYVVPY